MFLLVKEKNTKKVFPLISKKENPKYLESVNYLFIKTF